MTTIMATGGLDIFGKAATQTGTNLNPSPNPNPNKRAIAIEQGETQATDGKKPKAAAEEASSYYAYYDDDDDDDPNPSPIRRSNLDRANSTWMYDSDGESLSSSDSDPRFNYLSLGEAAVEQTPVVHGNKLGLVWNDGKPPIPCEICKLTDHGTGGCPCWWQIPDAQNPPAIDEDKYCLLCACGMVLINRKCIRKGCRASWPDLVVLKEDVKGSLAALESKT